MSRTFPIGATLASVGNVQAEEASLVPWWADLPVPSARLSLWHTERWPFGGRTTNSAAPILRGLAWDAFLPWFTGATGNEVPGRAGVRRRWMQMILQDLTVSGPSTVAEMSARLNKSEEAIRLALWRLMKGHGKVDASGNPDDPTTIYKKGD